MILQVKYSLWKKLTVLLGLGVIVLVLIWLFFWIKANLYEKSLNQKSLEMNNIEKKLASLKNNSAYKKYITMEVLNKKVNHINYAVLYEYLNQLKKKLWSSFRQFNVNRFNLEVQPWKVIIKTAIPNYNVIYTSGGMIDSLSNQIFVKNLNISEFSSINKLINFTITLETK